MQVPVEYHTVFTVLEKSVPWQEFVILPMIVVMATVVALVAIIQRRARLFLILTAYAIFLLFAASAFSGPGVRNMYARARNSYVKGQYSVVEGPVTNFHPMPYSGHQDETFSVNGVQFSYSDFELVPCFNNTSSHGGPIREGLRVRIAYSGNCILRLVIPGIH
jgi:hypothetical protein